MRLYTGTTSLQRTFALAIPIVAAAWLVTVPAVLSMSSFIALVGLLTAFAWVAKITYVNGQPAASLAQSLHDSEHPGPLKHREENR